MAASEDQKTPARHPTHNRARLFERETRGLQQQDQGHHPHGLRLPPREQSHRPNHAPLRRTRHTPTTAENPTHENSRSLKKNRKRPFTVIAGAPFIFCFSWPFHPIPIPTRRGPRPRYHSIRRTATGENNELVAFGRSARWNPLALLTHSSSERDFGKRP